MCVCACLFLTTTVFWYGRIFFYFYEVACVRKRRSVLQQPWKEKNPKKARKRARDVETKNCWESVCVCAMGKSVFFYFFPCVFVRVVFFFFCGPVFSLMMCSVVYQDEKKVKEKRKKKKNLGVIRKRERESVCVCANLGDTRLFWDFIFFQSIVACVCVFFRLRNKVVDEIECVCECETIHKFF